MSLEAFYEETGSDLAGVRSRLLTDERIMKFVNIFFQDPTFENLSTAMAEGNDEEAFRAAHTMKGISRDLGFSIIFEPACALADALRPNEAGEPADPASAPGLYAQLADAYAKVSDARSLL